MAGTETTGGWATRGKQEEEGCAAAAMRRCWMWTPGTPWPPLHPPYTPSTWQCSLVPRGGPCGRTYLCVRLAHRTRWATIVCMLPARRTACEIDVPAQKNQKPIGIAFVRTVRRLVRRRGGLHFLVSVTPVRRQMSGCAEAPFNRSWNTCFTRDLKGFGGKRDDRQNLWQASKNKKMLPKS